MDDDDLLQTLRLALEQAEPLPEHLRRAANDALSWRGLEAELAQLVYDSDESGLVGARSNNAARQVTFRAPGVEIEVMVDGDTRSLVGQLVPPQQARVDLTVGDVVETTAADSLGRFRFDRLTAGPIRLSVVGEQDVRLVHTEWIVI